MRSSLLLITSANNSLQSVLISFFFFDKYVLASYLMHPFLQIKLMKKIISTRLL